MLNSLPEPPHHQTQDSFFDTEHLRNDLKGRSMRGGAITIASQIVKLFTQSGGTLLLARLLTPEDFGLIGMVTALLTLAEIFKEFGISSAIIQTPKINHIQASTLFWINVGISALISIAIASLSPIISVFYDEPRLTLIVLALSGLFIISGLAVQHQAILRRQMQFRRLALLEIISMVGGITTAIVLAINGLGYWSMIISRFVQAITFTLGTWISCKWRPGLPSRSANVSSMLKFGANFTGFKFANYFSRNLDNILIGKYVGSQALGLYAMAYRLLLLPVQQINAPVASVAIPTLSILQQEPKKHARYYYRAILIITFIGMPIVSFLFVEIDNIVLILLGDQWSKTVTIFRLLVPAAFVGTFNVATGWIYMSLGRVDRQFRQEIIVSVITIFSFIVGIRWGALGVAAVYGLTNPLLMFGSLVYCFRGTNIRIVTFAKTILLPAFCSLISAVMLVTARYFYLGKNNDLISLFFGILLYLIFYFINWFSIPGGREKLKQIFESIKALKSPKNLQT